MGTYNKYNIISDAGYWGSDNHVTRLIELLSNSVMYEITISIYSKSVNAADQSIEVDKLMYGSEDIGDVYKATFYVIGNNYVYGFPISINNNKESMHKYIEGNSNPNWGTSLFRCITDSTKNNAGSESFSNTGFRLFIGEEDDANPDMPKHVFLYLASNIINSTFEVKIHKPGLIDLWGETNPKIFYKVIREELPNANTSNVQNKKDFEKSFDCNRVSNKVIYTKINGIWSESSSYNTIALIIESNSVQSFTKNILRFVIGTNEINGELFINCRFSSVGNDNYSAILDCYGNTANLNLSNIIIKFAKVDNRYKILIGFIGKKENTPTIFAYSNIVCTSIINNLCNIYNEEVNYDSLDSIWQDVSITSQCKSVGTTTDRGTGIYKGYTYFDTTLNKPIWWTGSKWIDATGADV